MSELASFSLWQWIVVGFLIVVDLSMPFGSERSLIENKQVPARYFLITSIWLSFMAVYLFAHAFLEKSDDAFEQLLVLLLLVGAVSGATRTIGLHRMIRQRSPEQTNPEQTNYGGVRA